MSVDASSNSPKREAHALASPPLSSLPASPTSAKTPSSSLHPTPVARFFKENSFVVEEDEEQIKRGRKSGSLEVCFGIVHLFRDDAALNDVTNAKTRTTLEDDSGCILAVLGVPSHIGPADFLQLIEPAADAISQVRMIREETAGRCMVLLKFRNSDSAEEFHKMYADQPFDPAEDPDELCRVVYVTKVTVSTTSTLPFAYPLLANSDPWPIIPTDQQSATSKSLTRATSTSNELPTCPVCLERMDSTVTGLMTVTCQHTFHCSCLSKWSDSRCPVCRYTQSRLTKKGHALPSFVPEHGCCAVCGTGGDLWVCLICATVGCGRYKAGHAHRHFQETGHLYSLELETQRVWDYAGDGYVHRLIQSKAEYKSAAADEGGPTPIAFREGGVAMTTYSSKKESMANEASGSSMGGARTSGSANNHPSELEEKMEALGMEYSHLLSTQLESQRAFYEDQVRDCQQKLDTSEINNRKMQTDLSALQSERDSLVHRLESVTSRHDNLHSNMEVALKRIKTLDEDLRGERLMSQGLVSRIDKLVEGGEAHKASLDALHLENADLKEQVRDLMFFVEARAKVANEGGEDLRGGDVGMPEEKQKESTGASASKNKKKKKVAKKPPLSAGVGAPAGGSSKEAKADDSPAAAEEDEQSAAPQEAGVQKQP